VLLFVLYSDAASVAIHTGVRGRDVDVREVQRELVRQGTALHKEVGDSISREQTQQES
jgi:hypothetical protein